MGIRINYNPPASTIGRLALLTGQGQARQRSEDIAREQASQQSKANFEREILKEEQRARIAQEQRQFSNQRTRDQRLFGYDQLRDKERYGSSPMKQEAKERMAQKKAEADMKKSYDTDYAKGIRVYSQAGQTKMNKLNQEMVALNEELNNPKEIQDRDAVQRMIDQKQDEVNKIKYDQTGLYSSVTPKDKQPATFENIQEWRKNQTNASGGAPGYKSKKTWPDGTVTEFDSSKEDDITFKAYKDDIKQQEKQRKFAKEQEDIKIAHFKRKQSDIKGQISDLEKIINNRNYDYTERQQKDAKRDIETLREESKRLFQSQYIMPQSEPSMSQDQSYLMPIPIRGEGTGQSAEEYASEMRGFVDGFVPPPEPEVKSQGEILPDIEISKLTGEDMEAYKWVKDHPNDSRIKMVLEKIKNRRK